MAEKQTNKERLKDITDSIETGIKELFESDKYRQYLATMSRFHKYSVNNTMLIYMQRPDATHVAGFNKWRDQFGRSVKKGEKGIKIIAPTPFKKKIEEAKLDPDTKLPMLDADGKAIMEEKEIRIPMYKPVTVFDVSQTAGKPLPELAANLTGDVQNYEVFMETLRRSAPVPICFEKLAENMDGYFSVDKQRIVLREGMSEVQTVCAAVHEIAHSRLHNKDEIGDKYQAVELFGKPALFSNGRIDRDKLPEGLYVYDLHGSDYDPGLPVTIQEHVVVNHAATVIAAAPIELPEQGFLYLGEDGLNFTGGPMTALVSGILSVMCGFMLLVYPSAGQWAMTLLFPLWFLTHCISNLTHLNWVRLTAGRVNYTISLVLNILGIVLATLMLLHPVLSAVSMSLTIGFYLILLGVDGIVLALSGMGR